MDDEVSQLRISHWPGVVPVPPVIRRGHTYKDGIITYATSGPTEDLPPELVLRSFTSLDVNDADAVLDFVDRYGVVNGDWVGYARFLGGRFPFLDDDDIEPASENATHINSVRNFLWLDQVLVDHWLLHVAGADPKEAWERAGFDLAALSTAHAWDAFTQMLNFQMVQAHARVIVAFDGHTFGEPAAHLDHALAIQLGNVIAEGIPPRTCANERCGNYFVRQEGRANPTTGQHRTSGVLYCSASCARAKGLREWRARKRAEGATQ